MSRTDSPITSTRMTVAEYLAFELQSEDKHDYVDGHVIDVRTMSAVNLNHSRIQVNLLFALRLALPGRPCEAFGSDLKVRSGKRRRYRYPDMSVACPPLAFDDQESSQRTLLNPRVLIEILSESTETIDRGQKFQEYIEIESLREYVLVSQTSPTLEVFYRRDDGQWLFDYAKGLEATARFRSLELDIPMSAVYQGITFPPPVDE